ncbi:MAG: hypothetical protein KC609_10650 [Myxococcales bacterium]|nr:hypothetical protein [Myxococcales bacterium]
MYEASASEPTIHEEIALIREIDRASETKAKRLAWISPVPLVVGIVLAFAVPDPTGSPVMIGLGLLTMIGLLVIRSRVRRTDFEDRRYELVDGLLRTLDLAKDQPVTIRLMLGPDKEVRRAKGTTEYETPWLHLEAPLADGNTFSLDRTSFKSVSVSTRQRGRTRVTTTTTRSSFVDRLGVRYSPGTCPDVERAGAAIAEQLRFPAFMAVQKVEHHAGELAVTARCDSKWDAGTLGGESIDAVALGAVMLAGLYRVLGRPTPADPGRAGTLPPARFRSEKKAGALAWTLRIAALLVLAVAAIFAYEYNKSNSWVKESRHALRYYKSEMAKSTPRDAEVRGLKGSIERSQKDVESAEALNSKRRIKLAAASALGLLFVAASLWASRRKNGTRDAHPE